MEVLPFTEIQRAGESKKTRFDLERRNMLTDRRCEFTSLNLGESLREDPALLRSKEFIRVSRLNCENRKDDEKDAMNMVVRENHIVTPSSGSTCSSSYEVAAQVMKDPPADCDYPEAVWVKWRGKWQTGIRCLRVDHPLPTLKAKPKNERKKYFGVFLPNTKSYSWVDAQLLRHIDETPTPLAYGTHNMWVLLVNDLTLPRRHIMQKLAVLMLDISDQLHTEAVIEMARKASAWKTFAEEASLCGEYPELGLMLLKLHSMILPEYIKSNWSEHSFDTWVKKCERAQSAEMIELLMEELVESVLWADVDKLWNAPVQPELGNEWRTWKQEVMKKFFTALSRSSCTIDKLTVDHPLSIGSDISQKHKKLGDKRTDFYPNIDADAVSLDDQDNFRTLSVEEVKSSFTQKSDVGTSENGNREVIVADDHDTGNKILRKHRLCMGFVEAKGRQCGRWATDGENYCSAHLGTRIAVAKAVQEESITRQITPEYHPNHQAGQDSLKYRKCSAFVEAKGRQCGRWANEGDTYCCVHLTNHFAGRNSDPESTTPLKSSSMCEGMTIYGKKCKHRAWSGTVFCKKHQTRVNYDAMISGMEKLPTTSGYCATQNNEEKAASVAERESSDGKRFAQNQMESKDASDLGHCIGRDNDQCAEHASYHTLYCPRHRPNFLKRARNGKSRLLSKEAFAHVLSSCLSRKEKIYFHRACELLHNFMKSSLSDQQTVLLQGDPMKWVLYEAAKEPNVGEYLLKLVSCERENISRVYGFDAAEGQLVHSSEVQGLTCKICGGGFPDDKLLSAHWVEAHNREAQWLFRGYACAICCHPFTNKKVLEAHVVERHGAQFLEDSLLVRCMSCSILFANAGKLWEHVLTCHSSEFRLPDSSKPIGSSQDRNGESSKGNAASENEDGTRKFVCRLCGLKFDLLPDLGRHHQAAHKNLSCSKPFLSKGNKNNKHLKHRRIHHSTFKKGLGPIRPVNGFKKLQSFGIKKCVKGISSVVSSRLREQAQASHELHLGRLFESECRSVAEALFTEMKRTESRPSNTEILIIAKSTCCRTNLHDILSNKYGTLPRNLYLKAAKLCSEANIPVDWHLEGFICPKRCSSPSQSQPCLLSPLVPLASESEERTTSNVMDDMDNGMWAMEECHYVLSPDTFSHCPARKTVTLCEDISFGMELVPIPCVVDEDIVKERLLLSCNGSLHGHALGFSRPWIGFSYATKRLLDPTLGLDTKSSQLGCACSGAKCSPEICDHVYLFDNDYENAEDVDGNLMRGRFPYDETGRIVVEEGCLVYECNSMCRCDRTCQNRILQNGVQVKLEVFRTKEKGWAVRAREAISRGRFICEYVGEVLNDVEATCRGERYDSEGCSYLYDIDAHIDDNDGRLFDGKMPYVIDATKHGNVARFINHSCSPNLVNYQVLVESMDCQLAHIGLYAARDILPGEELSYDYRYKLLPGAGCPCHCGASNCRGRLY